jgi:hypothetical protein
MMHSGSVLFGITLMVMPVTAHVVQPGAAPVRIDVSRESAPDNAALSRLIRETRDRADAFIFLSGGASKMSADDQKRLLAMFGALADLAASGRRFAVGDGGTQAGIMQASGDARRASGGAFPLIGIAPAREIPPRGKTPVDPNHSAIIAVEDPSVPNDQDAWGSETSTMYDVFARLAEGRPSVTVVANGGGIALTEVDANVKAGRRMLLIEGSGRAADALVSLIRGTTPQDGEVADLRARAEKAGLARRPDLFTVVRLETGPAGLRDALSHALGWTQ